MIALPVVLLGLGFAGMAAMGIFGLYACALMARGLR